MEDSKFVFSQNFMSKHYYKGLNLILPNEECADPIAN
jgi:hypothetical protein